MRWPAWLCVALMLWAGAVESTHYHPSQRAAASCSICALAHSTRPAVKSSHTAPVLAAVGQLQEKDVVAKARLDFSDAGIRGPPVL
jgi:hypothetical protein